MRLQRLLLEAMAVAVAQSEWETADHVFAALETLSDREDSSLTRSDLYAHVARLTGHPPRLRARFP